MPDHRIALDALNAIVTRSAKDLGVAAQHGDLEAARCVLWGKLLQLQALKWEVAAEQHRKRETYDEAIRLASSPSRKRTLWELKAPAMIQYEEDRRRIDVVIDRTRATQHDFSSPDPAIAMAALRAYLPQPVAPKTAPMRPGRATRSPTASPAESPAGSAKGSSIG